MMIILKQNVTIIVEGNQLSSDWFRSLSIGDILCDEIEVS